MAAAKMFKLHALLYDSRIDCLYNLSALSIDQQAEMYAVPKPEVWSMCTAVRT